MSKEEALPLPMNAESFASPHETGLSGHTGTSFGSGAALAAAEESDLEVAARGRGSDAFERWGTVIPPGATLAGRYRIDWFIARGGMGEVYAAYDRELGDRIALKTMTSALAGDPEGLAALKAEVSLSRKVSHGNVCRIHDLGVHSVVGYPNLMFLTMEFIEGESLAHRLERDGALSESEAIQFAGGILSGLVAAHEASVLHRDLKSDNIMLRKRAGGAVTPVIMDFGLASALNPNSSRVSGDQALVGSLGYMAPEQVQGDVLRAVTDVYSLGVILFEMLTGRLPFRASTPALAALKRLHEPAPLLRSINPNLSPEVERIVARALQSRPHDRYRSALAMLHELEALPFFRRSTPPKDVQQVDASSASIAASGRSELAHPRRSEPSKSLRFAEPAHSTVGDSVDQLAAAFDGALKTPSSDSSPVPTLPSHAVVHEHTASAHEWSKRELDITMLSGRSAVLASLAQSGRGLETPDPTGNTSLPTFVASSSSTRHRPTSRWTWVMLLAGVALGAISWLTATSDHGPSEDSKLVSRVSIGAEGELNPIPVTVAHPLTTTQPPSPLPVDTGRMIVSGPHVAGSTVQGPMVVTRAPASVQPLVQSGAKQGSGSVTGGNPIRPKLPRTVDLQTEPQPVKALALPQAPSETGVTPTTTRPKRPMLAYPPELRPDAVSRQGLPSNLGRGLPHETTAGASNTLTQSAPRVNTAP